MKAIIKTSAGVGNTRLLAVSEPVAGPAQVVIQLTLAGLCHTDVSMVEWNRAAQGGYHPTFPIILGHEYTGIVTEVGARVADLAVGQRVVGSAHLTCGQCTMCQQGRSMLCLHREVLGLDVNGVFSERFVVPRRNLVAIGDDVDDEVAVLAEPFAVGVHAMALAQPVAGERAAVVGPGSVGLVTVAALAGEPGLHVTAVGLPADHRQLEVAAALGAHQVAEVEKCPAELKGSFDFVIETAGHPAAVSLAIELVRPGGRVILVGLPGLPTSIDSAALAHEEKRLIGSRAYDLSDWQSMPRLLQQTPSLKSISKEVVGFDDFDLGIHLIASRRTPKVLLSPTA